MLKLRQKVFVIMTGMAVLLGAFQYAEAQRMRPPRVYNPRTYQNTRRQTSSRAAARAALKKQHKAREKGRTSTRRSIKPQ